MSIAMKDEGVKINSWDKNEKSLGVLVMQDKLFEKEGVAKNIDSKHLIPKPTNTAKIDNSLGIGGSLIPLAEELVVDVDKSYKIIPSSYKGTIRTSLGGTFYTNDLGKVYYEHDKALTRTEDKIVELNCPVPLPDYDFEPETGTIVKWSGDLTDRYIKIRGKGYSTNSGLIISFVDSNGERLNFINQYGKEVDFLKASGSILDESMKVPERADKLKLEIDSIFNAELYSIELDFSR